ncbi:MAG: serine hydrolase domain-containing protein [Acidimicrobiia bacterium]
MRSRIVVLAAALVAATVVPASTATAAPADADAALDRALGKLVTTEGGPPGVIVLVQRGDDLQVHRAGVAELATDVVIDADAHLRVASVAKAFSGATALSLVQQGVLSLDDTIAERLPTLPKAWGKVTLEQLLHHTSGLPDFITSESAQAALAESLTVPPPPSQLLDFVADEPLGFEPGSEYKYSNSDNIAVGLMVEAATGKPYADVLREQVYEPLALTNTSLPVGVEMPEPYVHGYDVSATPPEDVTQVIAAGWSWASGGIVSTAADLNRFARGYVGGKLFSGKTRDAQLDLIKGHSEPTGPGKNTAGLAIFRYKTKCGTVYGHTGNTPGYTQFIAASNDGSRSVTFSVTTQVRQDLGAPFPQLRKAEELAVCAALA